MKKMKTEICEKEGHQFRILKWWHTKEITDVSSTGTYPFLENDWYVLMVCLKCGKTIIKKAKKEKDEALEM